MELGLTGALLGGVLTLLSPCSVMLLPAFFAYAFTRPGRLLAMTGLFYLGLLTTLVPLGLLAGTVGAFFTVHRDVIIAVLSIAVIILGALMALGVTMPALLRGETGAGSPESALSVYLLGTVYGLAGVCTGPLLGAVLAMAAYGGSALYGALLLVVFAAGMVVPLVLLSLVWRRMPAARWLVRPRELVIGRWRNAWTSIVGGLLTVAIGVLMLATAGTTSLGGVLGVDDQARLESTLGAWSTGVPDWLAVTVAVAVLAAGWLVRRRLRRRPARPAAASRSSS